MNYFHSMVLLFFILIGVSIYFLQNYKRGKQANFLCCRNLCGKRARRELWSPSAQLLTDFQR